MILPPTRQLKKLGEITQRITKGATPTTYGYSFFDEGINFIKIENISNGKINKSSISQFISEDAHNSQERSKLIEGDILFSIAGTIGSTALVEEGDLPANTNQALGIIRGYKENAGEQYLQYVLRYIVVDELKRKARGGALQNISLLDLKEIQIPLPPLSTQHAIVLKLDAVQEQISEAKRSVQAQLDALDTLWQSSLSEVFENNEYELIRLGNIIKEPKKAEIKHINDQEDCSFVPMADMNQEMMYFDTKQIKKIGEVRKGYTYFAENDVILAKVTPCFENGKAGIAKDLINGIGFGSSEYYVFRVNEKILPQIIYYLISSKKFRIEGAKNMGGAVGLQRVKKERINNFEFYLPTLTEQESIVAHLDALASQLSALRAEYKKQLEQYDELRASTLDKAFKGELVSE